ncbi:MFS transporter [Picrophilus oshimae]|uniref:Transporter n=1 Tax=Picrophilus torridus (strain ATCC 700027 / DSM 9790 / JCM 10055 / NBRC 100828 / KAW 2/3) TaxID=1122961 RepID=Q6L098_PICTO|nr:MFS transporter [Picrophilus oshimae]AAT43604.1 transporter [Picrophilus oshimae DSM 9789]
MELNVDIYEKRSWDYLDSVSIIALASSFFMWGVALSIAPLITTWPFIPVKYDVFIIATSPAGLLFGNLFLGTFSDRFGRKRLFMLTVVITAIGLLIIALSYSLLLIIPGIFMAEFGLGGDETVSLAYIAEMLPKRYRGTAIAETTNMANIAITIMAGIFIFVNYSLYNEKISLLIIAILGFIIAFFSRLKIRESIRWEAYHKEKPDKNLFRYLPLGFMGIAIIVGFAFSDLVLGPFEFPKYSAIIIFFSVLAESLTGIIAGLILGRSKRKNLALFGFTGLFVSWLFLVIFLKDVLFSISLLIIILIINGITGEFGWMARGMLEPENFLTSFRGTGVGIVRSIGYLIYIFTVFALYNSSITVYAYYLLIIYLIGFAGAVIYMLYGRETNNILIH